MTRSTAARSIVWLVAALCVQLGVGVAGASAQVVVLRVDPAAEPLCQALESALGNFQLAPDPGYFAEARRRGLDPSSDRALAELVPSLQVQLAVVPQASDGRSVQIEFRGGGGEPRGQSSIPLQNGILGWEGRNLLQREIRDRLEAPAAEPESADASAIAEGGESEAAPAADELYLRVFGGAGMGMRDVSWPEAGEMLTVETGAFLAVELGASFGLVLSRSVELGPSLVYQTSLDHEIEEHHIDGASDTLGVRAHRFEALLALTLRLGASGGFHIAPELGYALRNLRPNVHHLLTPSYTLAGPLLRLTLRIPFGDSVALRLSPEVQYVLVGDDFEERGVESTGLAFGGQAGFEIALSAAYTIELTFREAHALLPSQFGDDAADVERFATARLVWQP